MYYPWAEKVKRPLSPARHGRNVPEKAVDDFSLRRDGVGIAGRSTSALQCEQIGTVCKISGNGTENIARNPDLSGHGGHNLELGYQVITFVFSQE